jgi:hypothetical protein
VARPPPCTAPLVMAASGASRIFEIDWAYCSVSVRSFWALTSSTPSTTEATSSTAAATVDSRSAQPGVRRCPPVSRPCSGGSWRIWEVRDSTWLRNQGGGSAATACPSRVAVSRSSRTSWAQASHWARWRSNAARSSSGTASST